jgi:hypothetical protein
MDNSASALVNEQLESNASSDKIERLRYQRNKHRRLLIACSSVDQNFQVIEMPKDNSWAQQKDMPSYDKDQEVEPLPHVCRSYLSRYALKDIRATGKRAWKEDPSTRESAPIKLNDFPKDKKIFTSSFLTADDALFPQTRLSDESARKLCEKVSGKKWTRPKKMEVQEDFVQTLAARGRTSMKEQLLRLIKVLIIRQRANLEKDSEEFIATQVIADTVDRISDIGHQTDKLELQSIHQLTLLLRGEYLKKFSFNDFTEEEQRLIRSASLLSSQVFPTQACFDVRKGYEERLGQDIPQKFQRALHQHAKPQSTGQKQIGRAHV